MKQSPAATVLTGVTAKGATNLHSRPRPLPSSRHEGAARAQGHDRRARSPRDEFARRAAGLADRARPEAEERLRLGFIGRDDIDERVKRLGQRRRRSRRRIEDHDHAALARRASRRKTCGDRVSRAGASGLWRARAPASPRAAPASPRRILAPGTTVIAFRPCASTPMMASPGRVLRVSSSSDAWRRRIRRGAPRRAHRRRRRPPARRIRPWRRDAPRPRPGSLPCRRAPSRSFLPITVSPMRGSASP